MLCIGSTGAYFVWTILRVQLELVRLGFTLKEQRSRLNDAGLDYDSDPRENIGDCARLLNCCGFFCSCSTPDSQILT